MVSLSPFLLWKFKFAFKLHMKVYRGQGSISTYLYFLCNDWIPWFRLSPYTLFMMKEHLGSFLPPFTQHTIVTYKHTRNSCPCPYSRSRWPTCPFSLPLTYPSFWTHYSTLSSFEVNVIFFSQCIWSFLLNIMDWSWFWEDFMTLT